MTKFKDTEVNIAEPYRKLKSIMTALERLSVELAEIITAIEAHPDYASADADDKLALAELKKNSFATIAGTAKTYFDEVEEE